MTRFDKFLAAVLDQARREARSDGSSTVDAHHLLLAVAGSDEPSTRRVLGSVGLDSAAVREALNREFERSLAAAGVSLSAAEVPRPSHRRERPAPLGSSVKLALERGVRSVAPKRPLLPAHLLLGILLAPVGTVPRALAFGGVDQAALAELTRQVLAGNDEKG